MQSFNAVFLVLYICIYFEAEACHNAQHMQEKSALESSGRRKRQVSVLDKNFVANWKPDYTEAPDADPVLSEFFSKCMLGKTGNIFESWTSVIDLILRDLLWFEATDAEYCGGRKDTVKCWHRRLQFLLRPESSLNIPGKECITEYDRMVKNEYGPDFELHYKTFYESFEYEPAIGEYKRWKRSLEFEDLFEKAEEYLNSLDNELDIKFTSARTYVHSDFPASTTKTTLLEQNKLCPAFDLLGFNMCVITEVNALINTDIIIEYPSLRNFNEYSNSKFIRDHHSNCRIAKSKIEDGFTYTETCEVVSREAEVATEKKILGAKPIPFLPFESCLIIDYPELVKITSPIFPPVSTCADEYIGETPTNETTIDRSTLERPKNPGRIGERCLKGLDMWTRWYDIDDASDDGDMETLVGIRTKFSGQTCENPKAVEARTKDGHKYHSSTKELLYLSTNDGLRCFNDEQVDGECDDYKIRFCCALDWPTCEKPNNWTPWLNSDRKPRVGGDNESLETHIAKNAVCTVPVSVKARISKRNRHYLRGRNILTISPEAGLVCNNSEQIIGRCKDYAVSFCCPS